MRSIRDFFTSSGVSPSSHLTVQVTSFTAVMTPGNIWAVFQTAQPFGAATGTRLRIELDFRTRFENHALGRFRLSVTNRPVSFAELRLARIKVDVVRVMRG